MEKISDLCIKCGMCCDGSLFRHAHLFDQEDIDMALKLGLEIVKNEGFILPCKFHNHHCTIWSKEKPKICDKYFCAPLKSFLNKEIAFKIAEKKILNLLHSKNQFLEAAVKFDEFEGKTLLQVCELVDNKNSTEPGFLKKYGLLMLLRIDLNVRLKDFFSKTQSL